MDATVGLMRKLAGPAADEVGHLIAQEVRYVREKRHHQLLLKTNQYLTDSRFEASNVPLSVLIPLLNSASLEEDEGLHDAWAALLANAAVDAGAFQPSFPEVLRQLSSRDAMLLKALVDTAKQRKQPFDRGEKLFSIQSVFSSWAKLGFSQSGSGSLLLADVGSELARRRGRDRSFC